MPGPGAAGTVQDRINQLEKQVISLMTSLHAAKQSGGPTPKEESSSQSESKSPPSEDDEDLFAGDQLSDEFGRISLEGTETTYVESGHWTAILDQVYPLLLHINHVPLMLFSFRSLLE